MYATLWRLLPGPTAAKVVQLLLLAAALLVTLDRWIFPAIAANLWINNVTIEP